MTINQGIGSNEKMPQHMNAVHEKLKEILPFTQVLAPKKLGIKENKKDMLAEFITKSINLSQVRTQFTPPFVGNHFVAKLLDQYY